MPGSVRRHGETSCAGFTLIELLLVVAIVGVVLASVRFGLAGLGGERQLDAEAQRLTQLLRLLSDQTVLTGMDYGLVVTGQGYEFARYGADGWEPLAADRLLRPRVLPDGMRLRVRAEGLPVQTGSSADGDRLSPQVLVLANGDFLSQEIEIHHPDIGAVRTLISDPEQGFILARAGSATGE
ncbi:MAG: type II secretion system minor pseudopilin GspH [Pseudomonadota bacterium]|nr:type II secretion system minor pseudopilin GspH [Pseudomonadota bacterium]